nr:unnamed protein product [Haemonchus contortus]
MLKDEVDSMCTGVIPQTKVEANSVHTLTGTGVIECNQMTDSVHTAIGDTEEECIAALEKVTVTEAAEETASDSSGSDFELIDVDEGGSISSSEAEESDFVTA